MVALRRLGPALGLALLGLLLLAPAARAQEEERRICVSSSLLTDGQSRAVNNEPALDFDGARTVFWSTYDAATDALQNADGSIEIFTSTRLSDPEDEVQNFTLQQVTESPGSILGGFNIMPDIMTLADGRTFVVFASDADLDAQPGVINNRDGGFEIFVAQTGPNSVPVVWQLTNLRSSSALLPVISEGTNNRARIAFVSDTDASESSAQGPTGLDADPLQRNFELFVATIDFGADVPGAPTRPVFVARPLQLTRTVGQVVVDQPAIAADGRSIAFVSSANTAAALTNPAAAPGPNPEIYLARLNAAPTAALTTFFQVTNTGPTVSNESPDVSRLINVPSPTGGQVVDASVVVFVSNAPSLGSIPNQGALPEVFAATVNSNATALVGSYLHVSKNVIEPQGRDITAREPAIDSEGRRVVFAADGCDTAAVGSNFCAAIDVPPLAQFQLFVADLNGERTNFQVARVTEPDSTGYRNYASPVMSGDGQYLAVVSSAGSEVANPDLSGSEVQSLYCPRANIRPEKSFVNVSGSQSNSLVDVGDTIRYTVTVANNSLNAFDGVIDVTDTLPPVTSLGNIRFRELPPPPGTSISPPQLSGGRLTWTVTDLPIQGAATVLITGTVLSAAAGNEVVNSVALSSTDALELVQQGLLVFDERTDARFTVTRVDLSASLRVNNALPRENEEFQYTVTLTNVAGSNVATNVAVNLTLPPAPSFTFVRLITTGGVFDPATGVWTLASVAPGSVQTLQLNYRPTLGTGGQPAVNARINSVTSDQYDTVPGNNVPATPVPIRVRGTDIQAVRMVASDLRPNIDETFVYTLVVRNSGPLPQFGALSEALYTAGSNRLKFLPARLEISSVLPPQLDFVSAGAGGTLTNRTVTWNVTNLTPPTTGPITTTVTMTVRVNRSAQPSEQIRTYISTLNAYYAVGEGGGLFPDPVPANDADNVVSTVVSVNDPASIAIPTPGIVNEGQRVTVTVTYTDTDVADTHNIVVRWGDGSPNSTANNVTRPPGQLTNSVRFAHEYADDPTVGSTYLVNVSITDSQGASGSNEAPVTVNNVLPDPTVATTRGALRILPDGSLVVSTTQPLTVIVPFTDPGYTAFLTQETFEYRIDWSDGVVGGPKAPEQVINGSAGGNFSRGTVVNRRTYPTLSATPIVGTVKIRDDDSTYDEVAPAFTFNVIVNNPPNAVNDTLTVIEKQEAGVDVLANDLDPGDTLQVTRVITTGTLGRVTSVAASGLITYSALTGFDNLPEGQTRADLFSYVVADSVGLTDTANVLVTVVGVNDPPVLDLDETSAALTTTIAFVEDAGSVRIAPNGRITDPDTNIASATLRIEGALDGAAERLIAQTNLGAIGVTWDAANHLLTLAGSAPPADYTSVLRGIAYTNTAESNDTSSRRVRVQAVDTAGAPTAALANVITIQRVDDALRITPSVAVTDTVESSPPAVVDAGIVVSDQDSPTLNSGALTVSVASGTTFDQLSVFNDGVVQTTGPVVVNGVNIGSVAGLGTPQLRFSFNANATPANVTILARHVAYRRLPGLPPDFVNIVWTGRSTPTGALGSATIRMNIVEINDPPTLGVGTIVVNEDQAVNIQPLLTFGDPELEIQGGNADFAIQVSSGTLVMAGLADSVAGPTVARTAAPIATLNNDAAWSLTYTPPANASGIVTFTFRLADLGVAPAPEQVVLIERLVDIVDAPDAPELDLDPANSASSDITVAYNEQAAAVLLAPNAALTDPDSTQMSSAVVAITAPMAGSVEQLTVTPVGLITQAFDGATGTLTLSGAETIANYQATLRTVRYANSSDAPLTPRLITWVVRDESNTPSTTRTATVNITPVNDAPALVISSSTLTVIEGAGATQVDPAATVTDADSTAFASGQLTVTVTDPTSALDVLGILQTPGQITLGAGNASVLFNGTPIASLAGYGTRQMRFTLVAAANPANLTALLRSVSYARLAGPAVAARSIRFDLREVGATPVATGARPLAVTAVNNAPEVLVSPILTGTEDANATIASSIRITDVDSGAAAVRFTASVNNGVVDFRNSPAPAGVTVISGDATPVLVLSGAIGDLRTMLATAATLTFVPTANFSGTATLTIEVNDQGNAPPPTIGIGSDSDSLRVRGVNDAPVVTVSAATTPEDTTLNIGGLIGLQDIDAGAGTLRFIAEVGSGSLAATLPANVTLVTNTPATVYEVTGSLSALQGWLATPSNLRYSPVANASGAVQLTVRLNDQGNSSWPPPVQLTGDATATITVSPQPDAPEIAGSLVMTVPTAAADAPLTVAVPTEALLAIDADSSNAEIIYTVAALPAVGLLSVNSAPQTACPELAGSSFTLDQVAGGQLLYTHTSSSDADTALIFGVANSADCSVANYMLQIHIRAP